MSDQSNQDIINFEGAIRIKINPENGRNNFGISGFQNNVAIAAYLVGAGYESTNRLISGDASVEEVVQALGRIFILGITQDLIRNFGLQLEISYVEVWEGSINVAAGIKGVKTAVGVAVVAGAILQGIAAAPQAIHVVSDVVHVIRESASQTIKNIDKLTSTSSSIEINVLTD